MDSPDKTERLPALQTWDASGYAQHGSFVPALGAELLDLLSPKPGERILDLGCGDGALTQQIAARGATVIGVDTSAELIEAARAKGLDVRFVDAAALTFVQEFDAVFSNAALHWMLEPDSVLAGVRRALKPGGRFIAEFGAHGNVAAIHVGIRAVLAKYSVEVDAPWYYPTQAEYQAKLAAHGFDVRDMNVFCRLTPLPTGMEGWLATFGATILAMVPAERREDAIRDITSLLRPVLCDRDGQWTADYVRLRFVADVPMENSAARRRSG